MHPVLFHLGTFPVGTYGLILALGLVAGLFWLRRLARAAGADADQLTDLVAGAMIAAVVGAELLLLITDFSAFAADPLGWFRDNLRALGVFYGGFAGAALYLWFAVRRRGLDFMRIADLMAPPLALAQGIGRLGCFAAGCCHGRLCDLPWAVRFHDPESLVEPALLGQPLHPVQLYEAFGNLVLAFFLARVLVKALRLKWPAGRVFTAWLALYGLSRFIYETFRGDSVRGEFFAGRLSTSQLIAAGMVALAAVLFVLRRKITPPNDPQTP